jgi:hypothetical protein
MLASRNLILVMMDLWFEVSCIFLLSADDEPIDLVLHVSSAFKNEDYRWQ